MTATGISCEGCGEPWPGTQAGGWALSFDRGRPRGLAQATQRMATVVLCEKCAGKFATIVLANVHARAWKDDPLRASLEALAKLAPTAATKRAPKGAGP